MDISGIRERNLWNRLDAVEITKNHKKKMQFLTSTLEIMFPCFYQQGLKNRGVMLVDMNAGSTSYFDVSWFYE